MLLDRWIEHLCIDEVGQSYLADPIAVAAIILHPNSKYRLMKDSKKLTQYLKNLSMLSSKKNSSRFLLKEKLLEIEILEILFIL